jgi:hypothetical protein
MSELTSKDKRQIAEMNALYDEGGDYFRESKSYVLWYMLFYLIGLGCVIGGLLLPGGLALTVGMFCLIQHIRYDRKARRVAGWIFKIQGEIEEREIKRILKGVKNEKTKSGRVHRSSSVSSTRTRTTASRTNRNTYTSSDPTDTDTGFYKPKGGK